LGGGSFTSKGHNLISNGRGGGSFADTDLVGTSASPIDPKLGPLQDNGGPTWTMALLPGSPAFDAGALTDSEWDQRGPGYARLANGATATIAEVYDTTVAEAAALFDDARAARILRSLADVGLDYVQLGQPSPTLSGGEAQRVKLARELARAKPGQLVFLDEPTTGLHPANLTQLVAVLSDLSEWRRPRPRRGGRGRPRRKCEGCSRP